MPDDVPSGDQAAHDARAASCDARPSRVRVRNAVVFCALAVLWVALDQLTKVACDAYRVGELIAGPLAGDLVDLRLVHNTGAAWGMFGDMTAVLGVIALVVCALIVVYVLVFAPRSSLGVVVGAALVFAGGLGNAIDRFARGYVVDFIEALFVDFPVFNVADVGVTCGVVLLVIAFALEWKAGRP